MLVSNISRTGGRAGKGGPGDGCRHDLFQEVYEQVKREVSDQVVSVFNEPDHWKALIAPAVGRITTAAQRFSDQLDVALILVGKPDSDYIAATALPSISDLFLAVGELDCWPNAPVEGEHGMSCS